MQNQKYPKLCDRHVNNRSHTQKSHKSVVMKIKGLCRELDFKGLLDLIKKQSQVILCTIYQEISSYLIVNLRVWKYKRSNIFYFQAYINLQKQTYGTVQIRKMNIKSIFQKPKFEIYLTFCINVTNINSTSIMLANDIKVKLQTISYKVKTFIQQIRQLEVCLHNFSSDIMKKLKFYYRKYHLLIYDLGLYYNQQISKVLYILKFKIEEKCTVPLIQFESFIDKDIRKKENCQYIITNIENFQKFARYCSLLQDAQQIVFAFGIKKKIGSILSYLRPIFSALNKDIENICKKSLNTGFKPDDFKKIVAVLMMMKQIHPKSDVLNYMISNLRFVGAQKFDFLKQKVVQTYQQAICQLNHIFRFDLEKQKDKYITILTEARFFYDYFKGMLQYESILRIAQSLIAQLKRLFEAIIQSIRKVDYSIALKQLETITLIDDFLLMIDQKVSNDASIDKSQYIYNIQYKYNILIQCLPNKLSKQDYIQYFYFASQQKRLKSLLQFILKNKYRIVQKIIEIQQQMEFQYSSQQQQSQDISLSPIYSARSVQDSSSSHQSTNILNNQTGIDMQQQLESRDQSLDDHLQEEKSNQNSPLIIKSSQSEQNLQEDSQQSNSNHVEYSDQYSPLMINMSYLLENRDQQKDNLHKHYSNIEILDQ